ncbi:acyl-CoA dehydrogenase family protein [Pseudonocardia endophytica]|uniref:Acyl-CoA dehydrogenase n=1 Tax=Pseudonocardia endophytica TaxID=401976 RepID=A0A4R1HP44_PSEEN|nr:acyl-CoA dehydrogenase family protein [Pseudonocardia endophytica]TCK24294.1 acyl-CoA dehydrogenase [Pseudonocardia endophytica]
MASSDLHELAESIVDDAYDADATGFDDGLWATLEKSGLARLTLPEAAGGSEGSFDDAATLLEVAGAYGARVPLVETDLLGGWLAHAAGLEVPDGPLVGVAATDGASSTGAGAAAGGGAPDSALSGADDGTVSGTLARVPWGRSVAAVVALVGERVVVLDPSVAEITEGTNVAEEPRDTLMYSGATPLASGSAPPGAAQELALRAALGRSLLLAGAARGALARSIGYAGERVQFGRPIGKFQAVQQQLAEAGSEVAAAAAASGAAARTAAENGFAASSTAFAVAAAKARCGEAATAVARIAHQVHGAIGFTREHDLRVVTTRLWAWRDEDGNDAYWNDRVGTAALDAGEYGLWPLVTGSP